MPKQWTEEVRNAPISVEGIINQFEVDRHHAIITVQDVEGIDRHWVIDLQDPNSAWFITVRNVSFLPNQD